MYLWLNNTIYEGPALAVMTTRSSAAPGLDLEPKSMKETNHHQLCAGWLMLLVACLNAACHGQQAKRPVRGLQLQCVVGMPVTAGKERWSCGSEFGIYNPFFYISLVPHGHLYNFLDDGGHWFIMPLPKLIMYCIAIMDHGWKKNRALLACKRQFFATSEPARRNDIQTP
jgi:hypothetical protein